MPSDTRQTINVTLTPFNLRGAFIINNGSSYVSGTTKSITSIRDGNLVPGHWRYNPVTIVGGESVSASESHAFSHNAYFTGNWLGYVLGSTMNTYWWYQAIQSKYPAWLVNSARIKAANKRLDSAYAGGVFLAELKDSLSMIVNPLKGARKLLQKGLTRSKKFRNKARRSEYLSSYWLQARYGWIPLANDITEIHQRVCLGLQRASNFYTTHGSERYDTVLTENSHGYSLGAAFDTGFQRIQRWKTRTRSTHGWNYVVGHETDETWSLLGLHYHDIPGIAWEMVPFSFVLDWWFKVGDFLQYIRPTPWLRKLGEGYSVSTEYESVWTPTWQKFKVNGRSYSDCPPSTKPLIIRQRAYQRTIPSAPVTAPVLDTRFRSVKHLADACALITQLRR